MNIPSIPASSSSTVTTNPLTRALICVAAEASARGKSSAVSATRLTERPSTPRWYAIPTVGTQGTRSANWRPAAPGAKRAQTHAASRNTIAVPVSPITRIEDSRRRSTAAAAAAVRTGRRIIQVRGPGISAIPRRGG